MKIKEVIFGPIDMYVGRTDGEAYYHLYPLTKDRYDMEYRDNDLNIHQVNAIEYLEKIYEVQFTLKYSDKLLTTVKNFGILEVLCLEFLRVVDYDWLMNHDMIRQRFSQELFNVRLLDHFE